MATSSSLTPHPSPWPPPAPKPPKEWKETSAARMPQSRLQHPHHQIMPLFASPEPPSPLPLQHVWPKCLVFTGARVTAGWDWGGTEHLGDPSGGLPRQAHQKDAAPQDARRLTSKLLLTPHHLCPPFPLPASFKNQMSRSSFLSFGCNYPTGQQWAPRSPLKNSKIHTTSCGEGEREEMITEEQRRRWDVQLIACLRGAWFLEAVRQHLLCISRLRYCNSRCRGCTRRLFSCVKRRQPLGMELLEDLFPFAPSPN